MVKRRDKTNTNCLNQQVTIFELDRDHLIASRISMSRQLQPKLFNNSKSPNSVEKGKVQKNMVCWNKQRTWKKYKYAVLRIYALKEKILWLNYINSN